MDKNSDRKELERRLEQAKRMAAGSSDPLTKERPKNWFKIWKNSSANRSKAASVGARQ